MRALRYLIVVSLLLAGFSTGVAQNKSASAIKQPSQLAPTNCETNIALLSLAHQAANEGRLLFAIARLGDGEYKRELNRRRLHNVRVYLTKFDWQRDPETLIAAEGERVKGYGRVELYSPPAHRRRRCSLKRSKYGSNPSCLP